MNTNITCAIMNKSSKLLSVFALMCGALIYLRAEEMVPLKTRIPLPPFRSDPIPYEVENLEPRLRSHPIFLVPVGTTNLAAGKCPTTSSTNLSDTLLARITDGEKSESDNSCVDVGRHQQWVQIDLKTNSEIFAVFVWHCSLPIRVYFDVVVQISADPRFETNVVTIFNNDADNTLGIGVGSDRNYIETEQGKLMDAKGVKGRYVRLYSGGSHAHRGNPYLEVEVFGRPLRQSNSSAGDATNLPSLKK